MATSGVSLRWIFLLALLLGALACNFPLYPASTPDPAAPAPTISSLPSPAASTPFLPAPPTPPTPTFELPAPATPAPAIPLPTATIPYQPIFEPAPCAFPAPAGYSPECGYLLVPEDRARPGSPIIRLHLAVFRSRSPDPAPDPVVHLAGGPGSSSLGVAGYLFRQGLGAILERRDFILFDQRGAGYSIPRLDCPEREALAPILLEGHLPPGESVSSIQQAFSRCHDRLVSSGITPSAYHSASSAADINDLGLALGYEQLNLYGVSYGTRLALTVMRDYPHRVRSAVLDSAYPPQVNLYTSLAPNAERAFNVLFTRCAADPACQSSYPGLREVFYDLVDGLNANPLPVAVPTGAGQRLVQVDGGLLVDVLFVGLYNPVVTAAMPKLLFDLRQGDNALLQGRLGLYFDTSSALGMQMAVQCTEEIPFAHPEEAFTAAQGVQPQIAAFFPHSVQPLFAVCQEWNPSPPDPRENQPVASAVPALVLAGEYDPITPPTWGRLAAGSLANAYFYEFTGNGHWVTRSSSCALAMALAFWEDPASAPDSSCMGSLAGLDFVR